MPEASVVYRALLPWPNFALGENYEEFLPMKR